MESEKPTHPAVCVEDFSHLLGTSDQGRCDHEVYEKGTCVFVTNTITAAMAEEFVRRVREEARPTRVDWSFAAGRVIVRALGELDRAKEAIRALRPVHDRMYVQAMTASGSVSHEVAEKCAEGIWSYNG